jgi:hypothetical protein
MTYQIKFTTREIAAFVMDLNCVNKTTNGHFEINFSRVLTELKRIGNVTFLLITACIYGIY